MFTPPPRSSDVLLAARVLARWALAAASAACLAQDPPPLTEAPAKEEPRPGELPAEASEAARGAWARLCTATAPQPVPGRAPVERVRAFQIEVDGDAYSGEKGSSSFRALYRYLEPGYVSMRLAETGRVRMRGPTGDWFVDGGRAVRIEGREFREDRRELDDLAIVSRTFAGLADPRGLRLSRLDVLAGPPSGLPTGVRARAAELEWIRLESPDLRRGAARASDTGRFEAQVGLDRATHLPVLVVFARLPSGPGDREGPMLLHLKDCARVDGLQVPHSIRTWGLEPATTPGRPPAFAERPRLDLYVRAGTATLRPDLKPADFEP